MNRFKSWDGVASCSPRFVDCLCDFSAQIGLRNLLQVSLQLHSSEVHWWPSLRGLHPADSSWDYIMAKMSDTKPFDLQNMTGNFWDVCHFHQKPMFPFFIFLVGKSWRFVSGEDFRGICPRGFFEASEASKVCQREGAEGLNSFFGRQPDRWDAPRSNQTMQGGFHDSGFVAFVGYQAIEGLGGFGHFWTIFYSFSSCQLSIFLWGEVNDFYGHSKTGYLY